MTEITLRTVLSGIMLGLGLALVLSLSSDAAILCPDSADSTATVSCSDNYMLRNAEPSSMSVEAHEDETNRIHRPRVATAGELVFTDFVAIEQEAYALLTANKQFRQDISPHQEKPAFDQLVRQFDYDSGFSSVNPDSNLTLQEHLDQADQQLRRARDLYAYLAVYADEARFRTHHQNQCDEALADVVAGTIDRCNFAARMRESVREVAYLRMIFGQQFTADAMGLHFDAGEIIGGEAFVRDEVKKLELAVTQYELAEQAVSEGMYVALGSGCLVSDFYTESEWALLSRAIEGMERAQHHIATRKSYLDDEGPIAAEKGYREAATAQFVQLVGLSGLSARPLEQGCQRGVRPDSDVVAKMVANMLDTRQHARDLSEGRNVFGFETRLTPAFPYQGLYDLAWEQARQAKEWQNDEVDASREFDRKQSELNSEIRHVRTQYDRRLRELTGCSNNNNGLRGDRDSRFFTCVDSVASRLMECDVIIDDQSAFNRCMNLKEVPRSALLRKSWEDLRTASIRIKRIELSRENIKQRVENERERNKNVNIRLGNNAVAQGWNQFASAMLESVSVSISSGGGFLGAVPSASVSFNPNAHAIGALRQQSTMRQAATETQINSENSEAAIRNLWLEHAELEIDVQVAVQEFNAQVSTFQILAAEAKDVAIEARRARAYIQNSPANDPSYRLVRDSARLRLASQLELASRTAYLAAKRAEYEYAVDLTAEKNFRISDIYRARTADDIIKYLENLKNLKRNVLNEDIEIQQEDFTISVAQHILGYTDENLGMTGNQATKERQRRFREWIEEHTVKGRNGKPKLEFNFTTSIVHNGIFSSVIQEGFDRFWLHQMAGIGSPKAGYVGFTINLITEQAANLRYRRVAVTQSGLLHLRSRKGCISDYRLVHNAALLGLQWPSNQPSESVTTDFKAGVNDDPTNPRFGERTSAFFGRPVSATDWQIELFAGRPQGGLAEMDLQQLQDIEIHMSTTRASRKPVQPDKSKCVRQDY